MMENFWKAALTVGGVAAIGAFVFWSLYKDWLALPIFSKMTSDQTFSIMHTFLWLTFIALFAFFIAYVFGGKAQRSTDSSGHIVHVGFALDWWKNHEGQALQQSQYVEGFKQIAKASDLIKEKILFHIGKKDGTTIAGSLISVTEGNGYIFVFGTSEGKYVNVSLSEIKQVTVLAVR